MLNNQTNKDMKNVTEMTEKELVANLYGSNASTYRFNKKVYAGSIFVNNEKIEVSDQFEKLMDKADKLIDTDEYTDLVFDAEVSDRIEYLLNNL